MSEHFASLDTTSLALTWPEPTANIEALAARLLVLDGLARQS